MALLTLKDVSYFYEGTHNGICDISFEAEKGDFIAVVGKNGAGKTTLLNVFILKSISRINPLTYQVDAMRTIAFGILDFTTICIVLVFTVVAYLFAIFCLSNSNFKNDEH